MRISRILLVVAAATASWLAPATMRPARAADHPVRVLDLCLQSGADLGKVSFLVRNFDEALFNKNYI